MNPIALDLGIIQIHWYSLTMLLAMLVGGLLFYKTMIAHSLRRIGKTRGIGFGNLHL